MEKLMCGCGGEMSIVHELNKTYFVCSRCGKTLKPRPRERIADERRLTKEEQIKRFKQLAKRYEIATDLIDWEAIIDGDLSYEENLPIVKNEMKKIEPKIVDDEFNIEQAEVLFNEHLKKVIEEEFKHDIDEIKSRSNPNLDKYFYALKEMLKIVVNGKPSGIVVFGDAGLGKTFITLQTLAELDKKVNEDFVYISTHITGLELFNMLYKYQDKVVILDDCERLLEDLKTVGILKSALWSSVGKRYVFYYSTTDRREAPEQFEFKGKLILLFNRIPTRYKEVIDSLISRVLTYRLEFTYEERIKIMYELCKVYKIPNKIVDFIKERTTPATDNINFRTLVQMNMIYEYYQQNPSELNGLGWEKIAGEIFEQSTDPIMEVVCEVIKSNLSVKDQVKKFAEKTGLSRTAFFFYKAKLNGKVKSWKEYS